MGADSHQASSVRKELCASPPVTFTNDGTVTPSTPSVTVSFDWTRSVGLKAVGRAIAGLMYAYCDPLSQLIRF